MRQAAKAAKRADFLNKQRLLRKRRAASSGLADTPGADACCADANMFANAADHRLNAAEIGIPATAAKIVCVANGIAVVGLFATNLTSKCHSSSDMLGEVTDTSYQRMRNSPKRIAKRCSVGKQAAELCKSRIGAAEFLGGEERPFPDASNFARWGRIGGARGAELCKNGGGFW